MRDKKGYETAKPLDRIFTNTYIFVAMAKKKNKKTKQVIGRLVFTKENYLMFFAGLLLILIGYVVMALGGTSSTMSLVIAPVILFVAYLVVVPVAILYRKRTPDDRTD